MIKGAGNYTYGKVQNCSPTFNKLASDMFPYKELLEPRARGVPRMSNPRMSNPKMSNPKMSNPIMSNPSLKMSNNYFNIVNDF